MFAEGADGTHKITLNLWNKLRRGTSKATKQSVDRRSGVKKKMLGALKALRGNHDRRLRFIRWHINGIKPFHTVNMPDQSHFFRLLNSLKDECI